MDHFGVGDFHKLLENSECPILTVTKGKMYYFEVSPAIFGLISLILTMDFEIGDGDTE